MSYSTVYNRLYLTVTIKLLLVMIGIHFNFLLGRSVLIIPVIIQVLLHVLFYFYNIIM